jgi:ATP-dependent RNA helicase SUPV3L1/SUV3
MAAASGNLVAVLGPTNTGKTHLAIERMLAHSSGMIGLPLRLLAREVYNRIAARVGADQVALITGEEKIVPPAPRFRVCTVEAMPAEVDVAFLAIDEIQLAGDLERGHVFTDRMLNLRGREETLLLGAATMRGIVEKLLPGVNIVTRPRMSQLTYTGSKKITRLPRRSAVVAFSADEVYAIAELIRRQRGGAAVVLGSLSPRTRNAQVELFQSGDVDFLVATDAIGMGLNLDVDHVAFASDRKFDGYQFRRLSAAELAQIAGRAGRHVRDGTFGVTSRVGDFETGLVEAIETHRFEPVKTVQWRNRDLSFASLGALKASLDCPPERDGLAKAPLSEDVAVLEIVSRDQEIARLATTPANVAMLWDVCQIPDYRKIAPANHAEMVSTIFTYLARDGAVPDDWFAGQVAYADRTDGDIDTLANRIAHIRTWTFAANRPQWLADPRHWQERTRAIEDRLSDALHECLTGRFVDRRTSVLMRRLKENAMLEAEITPTGDVLVEGQHVGTLQGFRFLPDQNADGPDGKALRAAAQKALTGEFTKRAGQIVAAANTDFLLSIDGTLRWQGAAVARVVEGDDALRPRMILLADDTLVGGDRDRVQGRIDLWLDNHAKTLLKSLFDLAESELLTPAARGLAYRLVENFGTIDRAEIAEEVRSLDQEARAGMRTLGVRFGAYHLYVPQLLKPAPSTLLAVLWALKNGGLEQPGLGELSGLAASGRTSLPVDIAIPAPLYRIVGYRIAGERAVRVDILERLADLIRPLIAWKPTSEVPTPPDGAAPGNGFTVTVAMTSLLGCAGEDFASVLRGLGYRVERRPAPSKPLSEPNQPIEPDPDPVAMGTAEESGEIAFLEDNRRTESDAPPLQPEPAEEPTISSEQITAEPAFVEIWRRAPTERPRRRDRPQPRPQASQPNIRNGATANTGEARRAKSDSRRGQERRPDFVRAPQPKGPEQRREKRADPDSPFAALAALKAQLEGKGDEN